jgi:HAMP domain-containing protein
MAFGGEGTFWLTLVNVLLAVVTLGVLLIVAGAAANDVVRRYSRRRAARHEDAAMFRRLGITMPDGGLPIDEMEELKKQEPEHREPTS